MFAGRSSPVAIFAILGFLTACQEVANYKSGGWGSDPGASIGNSSSLVTISGSVMSAATYASTQSSALLRRQVEQREFLSAFAEEESVIERQALTANDCSNSSWVMRYVGKGTTVVASGTADADGLFEIPSVPEGKEGVMTFSCSSGEQKCLVKAGDVGLNCNSIADGVVGALEASFGKPLTNTDFKDKTLAKVATSIVEASNSTSAEASSLASAITTCKSIANSTLKNACYKNSVEGSAFAANLEVAKTLARTWNVRGLFNFLAGTAGFRIEIDSFLYTDFGAALDDWLQTDFIAQARAYVQDLVDNPVYVGGLAANGEHQVSMVCSLSYSKTFSGGTMRYKPTILSGTPSCFNFAELSAISGIASSVDPRILALHSAIDSGSGNIKIQLGLPGDDDGDGVINHGETYHDFDADHDANPATGVTRNCPSNGSGMVSGSFCVSAPTLNIIARYPEQSRNLNSSGGGDDQFENRSSLIEVFQPVKDKLQELVTIASNAASPYYNCLTPPAGGDGAPVVDFARPICTSWLKPQFYALRSEFAGLMGLYMYTQDPASYASGGSAKLSLDDIHRLFTKKDFLNVRLTEREAMGYDHWIDVTGGGHSYNVPVMLQYSGSYYYIPDAYLSGVTPSITESQLATTFGLTSLLGNYATIFGTYESLPTIAETQAKVQYSSHHIEYNPVGGRTVNVPGKKINVAGTDYLFPIYCRTLDRKRLDVNSNPIPTQAPLNQNSKLECLSDPTAQGVGATATEGVYTYPAVFDYPFILLSRGDNGDGVGKVFSLGDRRTGQPAYLGGQEFFVLEANGGNSSIVQSGSACGAGFTEPSNAADAPVSRARVSYRDMSGARSELVTAYCLDMSSILVSDTNTNFYEADNIPVHSSAGDFPARLIAGRLSTSSTPDLRPVCFFEPTANSFFQFQAGSNSYTISSYGIGQLSANYSASESTGSGTLPAIIGASSYLIDFCDSTHASTSKYYLIPSPQESYDVSTNRGLRHAFFVDSNFKSLINGVAIRLSAIEASLANLQVANGIPVSRFDGLSFRNTRHDPKFDPYCDDRNANGKCDCMAPGASVPKVGACNLADTALEPTFSEPPISSYSSNPAGLATFFATYGGAFGAGLSGVDSNYFTTNNIQLNSQYFVFCQYLKTGETSYRQPSQIYETDWSNLHMQGCPDSSGALVAVDNPNAPTTGGGPIRVVKPVPMNNGYNVSLPKSYISLLTYATKTTGQGVTITSSQKVFSFDEALALVVLRVMATPEGVAVRNESGTALKDASPAFRPVRASADEDLSALSAVLKALVKPADLALPD